MNEIDKMRFTKQQKKFLSEYAKDLDLKRALTVSGYSNNGSRASACRFLAKKEAIFFVFEEIEKNASQLLIGKAFAVKKYYEILKYAMKDYEEKGTFDTALALKALEGLCKHYPSKDGFQTDDEGCVLGNIDLSKI